MPKPSRLAQFFSNYHPVFWVLIGGIAFVRTAYFMTLPFLAIRLSETTELSPTRIGFILGAGPLVGTFCGFLGGNLSDRLGRRAVLVSSNLMWSVVFFGFATVSHPLLFLLINCLSGMCSAVFESTSQAMISDLTPVERRRHAFGYRYLAINLGCAVGPALGAMFGILGGDISFLIASGINLAFGTALGLCTVLMKMPSYEASQDVKTLRSAVLTIKKDHVMRYLLLGGFFVTAAYNHMDTILPQFLKAAQGDLGVRNYAIVITTSALTVVLLQIPISRMTTAFSYYRLTMIGVFIFSFSYVCFAFSKTSLPALMTSMVIFTIGEIFLYTNFNLAIDALAGANRRGTYYGAAAFIQLGHSVGPVIGGYLLTRVGMKGDFLIMSTVVLFAGLIYRRAFALMGSKRT